MIETAAHLVDHVLPEKPIRQWVLCSRIQAQAHLPRRNNACRDGPAGAHRTAGYAGTETTR